MSVLIIIQRNKMQNTNRMFRNCFKVFLIILHEPQEQISVVRHFNIC